MFGPAWRGQFVFEHCTPKRENCNETDDVAPRRVAKTDTKLLLFIVRNVFIYLLVKEPCSFSNRRMCAAP